MGRRTEAGAMRVGDEDGDDDAAEAGDGGAPGALAGQRIDRWLCHVRLYRSRSLAATAVGGGRVHLNGGRVKPAHAVRAGDVLTLNLGGRDVELTVRALPRRRGPASEAREAYEESAASLARAATWHAARRLAAQSVPRPEGRPDKKERRALMELARRQGRD
jgi:ribosome-associated heat shock protein Hsp15